MCCLPIYDIVIVQQKYDLINKLWKVAHRLEKKPNLAFIEFWPDQNGHIIPKLSLLFSSLNKKKHLLYFLKNYFEKVIFKNWWKFFIYKINLQKFSKGFIFNILILLIASITFSEFLFICFSSILSLSSSSTLSSGLVEN